MSMADLSYHCIFEIRSHSAPPQAVKDVIAALLIVLGVPEQQATDWRLCRAYLEKTRFNQSVAEFDEKQLTLKQYDDAMKLIQTVSLQSAGASSLALGHILKWLNGVLSRAISRNR